MGQGSAAREQEEDGFDRVKLYLGTPIHDEDCLSAITLTGLPANGSITDARGQAVGRRDGDGWTLEHPTLAQLDALYLRLPATDRPELLHLNVIATSAVGAVRASSSRSWTLVPEGAHNAAAPPPRSFALHIDPAPDDLDIARDLAYYVSGLPAGARLDRGTAVADGAVVDGVVLQGGAYRLDAMDLDGLSLALSASCPPCFDLTVHAALLGEEVRLGDPVVVTVDIATSRPLPPPSFPPPADRLRVVIGGVPPGAALTGATDQGDGTWIVAPDHLDHGDDGSVILSGVNYAPAPGQGDNVTLRIVTMAGRDGETDWREVQTQELAVLVAAAGADAPGRLALDLGADLPESAAGTASLTIAGLPAGAFATDAQGHPVGQRATMEGGYCTLVLSPAEVAALDLLGQGALYFTLGPDAAGLWSLTTTIAWGEEASPAAQLSSLVSFVVTLPAD